VPLLLVNGITGAPSSAPDFRAQTAPGGIAVTGLSEAREEADGMTDSLLAGVTCAAWLFERRYRVRLRGLGRRSRCGWWKNK
jgi:hypothetical protein